MRSLTRTSSIFLALLILSVSAWADVAPDPGYSNVPADLTLETTQDLSKFRFFLRSVNNFEEIFVTPNSPTVISASGRGGVAKVASLIAVPVSEIGNAQPDAYDPGFFRKRYLSREPILTHYFQTTVPIVEKPIWKPPVYRLSIENGTITAAKSSNGGSLLWYAIPIVAAGVLMTLGIAIIGVWLFRRSRRNV